MVGWRTQLHAHPPSPFPHPALFTFPHPTPGLCRTLPRGLQQHPHTLRRALVPHHVLSPPRSLQFFAAQGSDTVDGWTWMSWFTTVHATATLPHTVPVLRAPSALATHTLPALATTTRVHAQRKVAPAAHLVRGRTDEWTSAWMVPMDESDGGWLPISLHRSHSLPRSRLHPTRSLPLPHTAHVALPFTHDVPGYVTIHTTRCRFTHVTVVTLHTHVTFTHFGYTFLVVTALSPHTRVFCTPHAYTFTRRTRTRACVKFAAAVHGRLRSSYSAKRYLPIGCAPRATCLPRVSFSLPAGPCWLWFCIYATTTRIQPTPLALCGFCLCRFYLFCSLRERCLRSLACRLPLLRTPYPTSLLLPGSLRLLAAHYNRLFCPCLCLPPTGSHICYTPVLPLALSPRLPTPFTDHVCPLPRTVVTHATHRGLHHYLLPARWLFCRARFAARHGSLHAVTRYYHSLPATHFIPLTATTTALPGYPRYRSRSFALLHVVLVRAAADDA